MFEICAKNGQSRGEPFLLFKKKDSLRGDPALKIEEIEAYVTSG